jgi:hypothetical protein
MVLFDSPVIRAIAESHGGPAAVPAVVLSWALQRGVLVLPRSSSDEHIESNARLLLPEPAASNSRDSATPSKMLQPVFLSEEELARMDSLDGAVDAHAECGHWAALGECTANPGYMLPNCGAACGGGSAPPLSCSGLEASGGGVVEDEL